MDEKPHISPSAIGMYLRCGEQYRRVYREKERAAPGVAALIGSGVHDAAQVNFKQKMETMVDLPPSQMIDAAVAAMDTRILQDGVSVEEGQNVQIEVGKARDMASNLAAYHAINIAPEYFPAIVEEPIRVPMVRSTHDLYGIIDLADHANRVIDFKTTGRKKHQEEADRSLQLTSYAVMWHHKTGRLPASLRLDVTYRKDEPSREVIETTRGIADVQILVHTINAVLAGINAGVFPPAPQGSWWCSKKFCGFYSSCPYTRKT